MSDYIIVRTEGLYKIYRQLHEDKNVYQYSGATFVMLQDAEDFIEMKNAGKDAS